VITGFADSLQVLPLAWEEVIIKLRRSGIVDAVRPLLDLLPTKNQQNYEISFPDIKYRREIIRDFTKKLIVAETAEAQDFLPTIPLRQLASDHIRQVPITVVVGAKGSGKTYTFLQIIRRENWQNFAEAAGANQVQINAFICPVLSPINSPNILDEANQVRHKTAQALNFNNPLDISKIREHIRNSYRDNLNESEWRERWLDLIAWSVGFQPEKQNAGRELAENLQNRKHSLLGVWFGRLIPRLC
jgi:hypothetical protein